MTDRRRRACWPRNNFGKAPMDAIGAWVLVTATILLSLVFLAEVLIVPAVS
jgi:hypothetical protein